jgi:hypothetical protein
MLARRANPQSVKLHRSYSVRELAKCCGVHPHTVRNWQREGLEPNDKTRPLLFHGAVVRAFLSRRKASRKRPCPPGTLYCFRCREPRRPSLGMVEYRPLKSASGDLCAICEACEGIMHRRVRKADLGKVMPNLAIQIAHASPRLIGRTAPSPNCDSERRG